MTWNSPEQRVKSLSNKAQAKINAPLHGLDAEHQAWEILDNFDTLDHKAHSANQQPVLFELANKFFLVPSVDFTGLQDTGSAKHFIMGMTDATQNVAAQMEAAAQAASGMEAQSTASDLTHLTTTATTSHRGMSQGCVQPSFIAQG